MIMYADEITGSMERAIGETNRRRKKQQEYNEAHGIVPKTIVKEIRSTLAITDKNKKAADIAWELFEKTGNLSYYMLYKRLK